MFGEDICQIGLAKNFVYFDLTSNQFPLHPKLRNLNMPALPNKTRSVRNYFRGTRIGTRYKPSLNTEVK